MSRVVLVLLVLVAVASALPQYVLLTENCGPNEQYYNCAPLCEPTCDVPRPESCVLVCKPGCDCKRGFVRNRSHACVLPSQC